MTTTKPRLRDLGIQIGSLPPGPTNSITDVPGVLVGMCTVIADAPSLVRTGVTAIFPSPDIHTHAVFAAAHVFNGIGELTGLTYIEETGQLISPVLLTGTLSLGAVHEAIVRYGTEKYGAFTFSLPVVGETYDGWLSDPKAFPLTTEHVNAAIEAASDRGVDEGNTGGGTGMICYEFKGGTGSASRVVQVLDQSYRVGALVQANHGDRGQLTVGGVNVGAKIGSEVVPLPWQAEPGASSILVIIATDAPLLPNGCKRLAQRATVGLARTGGYGLNGSGDIFLAFSTGNRIPRSSSSLHRHDCVPFFEMDNLILATAEAVEEAILNALVAAETMTGRGGHTAHALPHDQLVRAVLG
ncbi:MAG: P1 family peptidase [Anaerolineae bacterium]|jgi:D-aminopeptidase|nr:P1 family peptidase [Anaerolineae bacterium]MCZ7553206.1 P1 family peptidase [Anaerolineales bacterium]